MRHFDWPNRLNKYFLSVKDRKFQYGDFDCCVFVADAVKAMTSDDLMSEFRGEYHNKKEAMTALKTIGAGTLLRTLRKKFGKPVRGAKGQRGDIAFHDGVCGIITGPNAIFIRDVHGFGTAKISKIKWAFKVV